MKEAKQLRPAPKLPKRMEFDGGFYATITRFPSGNVELNLFSPDRSRIMHKRVIPTDTEVFIRMMCKDKIRSWVAETFRVRI